MIHRNTKTCKTKTLFGIWVGLRCVKCWASALMNMYLEYRNMAFLHLEINIEGCGIKRGLIKRMNVTDSFLVLQWYRANTKSLQLDYSLFTKLQKHVGATKSMFSCLTVGIRHYRKCIAKEFWPSFLWRKE